MDLVLATPVHIMYLRAYIMRASYHGIVINDKQKMCGKVSKDITFIQFFHSTYSTFSTELFKILFSLLTLYSAFLQKASVPGKIKQTVFISLSLSLFNPSAIFRLPQVSSSVQCMMIYIRRIDKFHGENKE